MVYESDFYTVRRPYARPTITSYSVTGCRPSVWKTTTISPVGAHSKVRLSVLLGELNRIQNRPRMHLGYVPTEDFLNSRPLVAFDDEAKYIRAEADKLMKYIYVPVPHQTSRIPPKITTCYDRLTGNGLDRYRYGSGLSDDINTMSYYYEPTRATIGRGHLACVTFAGGRGYPRRKHLFADENRDIRDEIKVRSYYNKLVNPSARVDESLALPTGFAARLLLSERKPISETEAEKKVIKPSRFRKTEIIDPLGEKKERITDKWLDPIENDKSDRKHADEQLKIQDEEIPEKKYSSRKKFEDDLKLDITENSAIVESKNEPATPPVNKEKVKPKKESRRKMSEKLAEIEKIPETPTKTKTENDILMSEKEIEQPITNNIEEPIVETTSYKNDSVQNEPSLFRSISQNEPKEPEENIVQNEPIEIEEKPVQIERSLSRSMSQNEPKVAEENIEQIESKEIEEKPVQIERSLSRSISQNEPKEIEENVQNEPKEIEETIADSDLKVDNKEEELVNEQNVEEEQQKVTESIPDEIIDEQVINDLQDKTIADKSAEEEHDKQEIEEKLEDTSEEKIEEKETEVKESEELKQSLVEDISKAAADEQISESEQLEAVQEQQIQCRTNEELESSLDIKEESETIIIRNETKVEFTESVTSVKQEVNIVEISNQLDSEQLNHDEDMANDSLINSDENKLNTEPIVEEPLSPQDVDVPQLSDNIQTIQEEL